MNVTPEEPFKSKLFFCWLALLTGAIGGHWIYAGKKKFWIYMLAFPLSAFAGWADAMRYGLMKDEEFNARLNPEYASDMKQTTGAVVVSVVLSLALGVTALMALLAMVFQWYFSGVVS